MYQKVWHAKNRTIEVLKKKFMDGYSINIINEGVEIMQIDHYYQ